MTYTQRACLIQTSVGPVLAASVRMYSIRYVPGTSLVIRVRELRFRCEMCFYMCWNMWSAVMALYCEIIESYGGSASLEKNGPPGVYSPARIPFYFLGPDGKCNMTSHLMHLPLYLSQNKPFLKLLHLFVEPWLPSDLNFIKPKDHSTISGLMREGWKNTTRVRKRICYYLPLVQKARVEKWSDENQAKAASVKWLQEGLLVRRLQNHGAL